MSDASLGRTEMPVHPSTASDEVDVSGTGIATALGAVLWSSRQL